MILSGLAMGLLPHGFGTIDNRSLDLGFASGLAAGNLVLLQTEEDRAGPIGARHLFRDHRQASPAAILPEEAFIGYQHVMTDSLPDPDQLHTRAQDEGSRMCRRPLRFCALQELSV